MKQVLIITCLNLYVNSSVNMANIAYINGFIKNGYDVTVVMADADSAEKDYTINVPDIKMFIYPYRKPMEAKLAQAFKPNVLNEKKSATSSIKRGVFNLLRKVKNLFQHKKKTSIFSFDYFMNRVLANLSDFNSIKYDLVVSISSPVASHHLTDRIIATNKLQFDKWIQIWEDPWYSDLYVTDNKQQIFVAERDLLLKADKVFYVSPLTCKYQKELYPAAAEKMDWAFLPCYKEIMYPAKSQSDVVKLGYFGEYYSFARNILPLAEAVDKTNGVQLIICGNSDVSLSGYRNIVECGRVDMATVDRYQSESDVLINVSNLGGGQIPGKVYQYAGTNKDILFVLDGHEKEKQELKEIFAPYNRYIFCDNNAEAISSALQNYMTQKIKTAAVPVDDFKAQRVVEKILGCLE